MAETAFTVRVPADRISGFRELLAEVDKDVSGLAERAREVGYYRERMWLQPRPDGDAQLIVMLEFDDVLSAQELIGAVVAYESEFTTWWNPRYYEVIGSPPLIAEAVFSWDDEGRPSRP